MPEHQLPSPPSVPDCRSRQRTPSQPACRLAASPPRPSARQSGRPPRAQSAPHAFPLAVLPALAPDFSPHLPPFPGLILVFPALYSPQDARNEVTKSSFISENLHYQKYHQQSVEHSEIKWLARFYSSSAIKGVGLSGQPSPSSVETD